jgi:hypothetical protein
MLTGLSIGTPLIRVPIEDYAEMPGKTSGVLRCLIRILWRMRQSTRSKTHLLPDLCQDSRLNDAQNYLGCKKLGCEDHPRSR